MDLEPYDCEPMETLTTAEPIKAIITKRVSQGETLSSLAQKLGYTSPSILSMILGGKRIPLSQFTLRLCKALELSTDEVLSLLATDPTDKSQLKLLDPPFSGVERKELFKYLNSPQKSDLTDRPAFKLTSYFEVRRR